MKVLIVISALLLAQVFAEAPNNGARECVESKMHHADEHIRADLEAWLHDVHTTTERLRLQRQRCDDIHRDGEFSLSSTKLSEVMKLFPFLTDPPTLMQDRIIQACEAAWSASFAYETARLTEELRAIDPELASEIMSSCFGIDGEILPRRNYFE